MTIITIIIIQASLICGNVEAPLGEKARPLEPLKDWSLCPPELLQALEELLWATLERQEPPMQLFKAPLGPFCCKHENYGIFSAKICNFCRKTSTYAVFGPNNHEIRTRRIFWWYFYAWRRGHILIMLTYISTYYFIILLSCFFSYTEPLIQSKKLNVYSGQKRMNMYSCC